MVRRQVTYLETICLVRAVEFADFACGSKVIYSDCNQLKTSKNVVVGAQLWERSCGSAVVGAR